MTEFNDRVIADFRAHHGHVDGWGANLVLLHHRGARTGAQRINPAMSLRDGDGWLVVGSAAGAARDPAWVLNLRANPAAAIEAVVDDDIATVAVQAAELHGDERQRAFRRFVEFAPTFEAYQAKTTRTLPVFRLQPRPGPVEAAAAT